MKKKTTNIPVLKFGERLKELRIEKKLTQQQLSINLNCTIGQSTIAMWEANLRIPSLDAVIILAQYFGVTLDYIAGLED